MRRGTPLALAVALVLTSAALAIALAPYVLNPSGTDPLVNGTLTIQGDPNRAPLRVTLLTTDPPSPTDGSVYVVHTVSEHRICFAGSGSRFCAAAILTP
jgi:hypothetical protein